MAKYNRATVDQALRDMVMEDIFSVEQEMGFEYRPVNDRQYGVILTDLNGHRRYVRIGFIVAEEREDLTAEELMAQEIAAHQEKVAAREEKARVKAEKIARDKARREEQKKQKEENHD